jgi:hypothetical protein
MPRLGLDLSCTLILPDLLGISKKTAKSHFGSDLVCFASVCYGSFEPISAPI